MVLLVGATGCSESDPERQIRERIAAAVAAAEARDTGFFRDLIAESFVDQRGNDRQSMLNLVRAQFFLNQRIDVISRVQTISLEGDDAARTVLAAGLVGSPGSRIQLGETSGDLYRIELEWIKDGADWRVIGAEWSGLGGP